MKVMTINSIMVAMCKKTPRISCTQKVEKMMNVMQLYLCLEYIVQWFKIISNIIIIIGFHSKVLPYND